MTGTGAPEAAAAPAAPAAPDAAESAGPPPEPSAAGECPRCGHDLRGTIAGWRNACPLSGRCTECGVGFAWGDLLSGRLTYPRWSVEGASGPIDWGRRVLPQLVVATIRPRLMLRRLRLEHRIRPPPLLAAVGSLAILLVAAVWGLVAADYAARGVPGSEAAVRALRVWELRNLAVEVALPAPGGVRVAVPSRGSAFVVDRAGAGFGRLTLVPRTATVPARGVPVPRQGVPALEIETDSGGAVVAYADVGGGRRVSATAIANLRQLTAGMLVLPPPVAVVRRASPAGQGLALGAGLPIVLATTASVLVFAVLPIARRRARVRWAHLGRLALLALLGSTGAAMLLAAFGHLTGIGDAPGELVARLRLDAIAAVLGLMDADAGLMLLAVGWVAIPIAFAATWWTWAARDYLRMQRPLAVGLSVAAVADLLAIVVVVTVFAAISS